MLQKYNIRILGHRDSMIPSLSTIFSKSLTLQPTFTETFSQLVCLKVKEGLSNHLAMTFSTNIPVKAQCNSDRLTHRKFTR